MFVRRALPALLAVLTIAAALPVAAYAEHPMAPAEFVALEDVDP